QATGHDLEHDLTLAAGERVKTLSQSIQGLLTLPPGPVASKSSLDGLDEVLITERFRQELHGAALHRLHGHRDIGVRCDEDDGHLPVRRGKVALKLETASSRHSHVEYQASRPVPRRGLQEIRNR